MGLKGKVSRDQSCIFWCLKGKCHRDQGCIYFGALKGKCPEICDLSIYLTQRKFFQQLESTHKVPFEILRLEESG